MALGDGSRFVSGVAKIESKEGYGAKRAAAIMASVGRKKYGAKKMAKWSASGRKDS